MGSIGTNSEVDSEIRSEIRSEIYLAGVRQCLTSGQQ
jgi:hypothetical protein